MPVKILVIGALNGQLSTFLPKLTSLQSKQNFDLAICLGDVFSPPTSDSDSGANTDFLQALVEGKHPLPLPTYFSIGRHPLPEVIVKRLKEAETRGQAGEVCENLVWLGRKGTVKTSEGVRIVVLGGEGVGGRGTGKEEDKVEVGEFDPQYTDEDASVLKGVNGGADVLVTWEWPEGVERGSAVELKPASPNATVKGSKPIAELVRRLRPRYHFVAWAGRYSRASVSGNEATDVEVHNLPEGFWEREPYRNEILPKEREKLASGAVGVTAPPATRVIAVAAHGNAEKAKALYAFNLPLAAEAAAEAVPPNATESPFLLSGGEGGRRGRKRGAEEDGGAGGGGNGSFFWGDAVGGHHNTRDGGGGGRGKRGRGGRGGAGGGRPLPGPDTCFFCLSNPTLEKHLLISIGNDSYLALAKGPLPLPTTTTTTTPSSTTLPFPGHILIIPLPHSPLIHTIHPPETRSATYTEMTRYRHSLFSMLRGLGYGCVVWEVARGKGGVHTHWQVVPYQCARWSVEDVERRFLAAGENGGEGGRGFVRKEIPVGGFDESIGEVKGGGDPSSIAYFRVWVMGRLAPSTAGAGAEEKEGEERYGDRGSLVLELDPAAYFDLQFGRRVMAGLLFGPEGGEGGQEAHQGGRGGLVARVDWRECVQSKDEEVRDARRTKEAFREFDFTL